MSFASDIKRFADKTNANMELTVKSIVAHVAQTVVEASPVGDGDYWKRPPPAGYVGGHFRANWDYGVGAAPLAEYDDIDASGAVSMQRILSGMEGAKMVGSIHYIANNLPYAERLENGWSRQAPHGMVAITAMKFQSIVAEAAR